LSAPQAPIWREKLDENQPFFAQKSPAARFDATSSMACLPPQAMVTMVLAGMNGTMAP
jgi:hypothetical protein